MKYDCCINLHDPYATHNILVNSIKSESKVLDVGCAQGYIGKYLFEQKNCKVIGIDYLKEHIEEAKNKGVYSRLFQIDLNTLSDELNEYQNYFDYILLADVLEHLYFPKQSINKFKKLLKKEGSLLISIPNISHGSIILNLLRNKFQYTPTGLLDETHIRFFTLNSFVNLLTEEKLQIISIDASIKVPTETEQHASFENLPNNVVKHLVSNSEIFCYQYIFKVKNSDNVDCKKTNEEKIDLFKNELNKSVKKLKMHYSMPFLIKLLKYPRKTIGKYFN